MHGGGLDLALVFLLAAVIAVPVFKRFGLGAVLGYLAACVALGPNGFGVIRDAERVLTAAEIGVVMMLFVIGLELSLPRLKVMRRPVFLVGGLQVALTGVALCALMMGQGLGWKAGIVVGLGLALSSTAVGLQLLSERKEMAADHGRLAFAILLFQDLAAIPLLAAIPMLGSVSNIDAGENAWLAIGKGVGAIAVLVFGGRVVLRHVFKVIARTGMPEVFTAAALLVVLGSAWLMQLAGLSAGLGAFLAGVLLADSEFRHELESQIQPFEGLLLGLFFMAVGMSIDLDQVIAEPVKIAIGVTVLMTVKFALLFLLGLRPGNLGRRSALMLAGVLALGGEFAFVVFTEADRAGLLKSADHNRLVAIVGVSMALTPLLLIALSRLLPVRKPDKAGQQTRAYDQIPDGHPQVLIAGFGRMGQIVARLLSAQKVRYVAIDSDAEEVDWFRSRLVGSELYYGDPSKPDLLRAAGAANIKVFVITVPGKDVCLRIVRLIRRHYPNAKVFARAHDRTHAWQLMDLGAKPFRETFGTSLDMGRETMVALGLDRGLATDRSERFREHDTRILAAQHLVWDDEEALMQTTHDARRELEQLFAADEGEGELGKAAISPES